MPDSHKHRLRLPADIRRGLVHRTVLGLSRLLMLAALLPLGACSKPTGEQVDGGMATANISPYNHTGDYIHQLYIDGQWGGNSRAYGGRNFRMLHRLPTHVEGWSNCKSSLDHVQL